MSETEKESIRLVERYSKMLHNEANLDFIDESIVRVAKQCALICVDEMQKVCNGLENWNYLEQVKNEINKI